MVSHVGRSGSCRVVFHERARPVVPYADLLGGAFNALNFQRAQRDSLSERFLEEDITDKQISLK